LETIADTRWGTAALAAVACGLVAMALWMTRYARM